MNGPSPYNIIAERRGEDLADAIYMAMHLYDRPKRKGWSKAKFVRAAMFSMKTKELEKIMETIKEVRR